MHLDIQNVENQGGIVRF